MKIAVIGAGSVGSQAARAIAEMGHEVEIFDRWGSPNPWGSHAGESRLVRRIAYLEGGDDAQRILQDSMDAWATLEEESGVPLFHPCGGLMIERPSSPAIQPAKHVHGVKQFSPDELRNAFPQFSEVTDEVGILDEAGGLIDPQLAVAAALRLACVSGAQLRLRERVLAVRQSSDGVTVEIASGNAECFDRAVVATGAFVRELLPQLPVRSRRLLLAWFEPEHGQEHFLKGFPSFGWSKAPGQLVYGGPSEDGRTVKLGIDLPYGDVEDAAAGRVISDDELNMFRTEAKRYFPWLNTESGKYEMHIDGWSSDLQGILGPVPGQDRIIVAAGWSGFGFKISPVLGRMAARLSVGESVEYDISSWNPARFNS